MNSVLSRATSRALWAAAAASAAMVAFDIAGRATRDALFLSSYGPHAVPLMVLTGSAIALVVGLAASRLMTVVAPVLFMQRALVLSAVALVAERLLLAGHVGIVSIVLYAHFTAVSGLLLSGFWTVVSERFDPRTSRRFVPHLAAAGTFGGLVGGLTAEQVASHGAIGTMLLVLAVLNLGAAIASQALLPVTPHRTVGPDDDAPRLRRLVGSRYVQLLLAFVVVSAVVETLLDFVFLSRASSTTSSSEALLRTFAIFYTGVAIVAMLLQLGVVRRLIDLLGITPVTAMMPVGVGVTGVGLLVWPGMASAVVARGTELVLRNSTFRSTYEVLFGAMPRMEKRGAKTLVDVTGVRAGRMLGSGVVQAAILLVPGREIGVAAALVIVLAIAAIALLPLIRRRYLRVLAANVVARAPSAEMDDPRMFDTGLFPVASSGELFSTAETATWTVAEVDREELAALLRQDTTAWPVAVAALPMSIGDRVAALAGIAQDDTQPMLVRRRAVRALGAETRPESMAALALALDDVRFEIRFHAGIALERIAAADASLVPARADVLAVVSREVDVSRPVWIRRELVPLLADDEATGPRELLGEVLQERTERSVEHVFRLLALCLPAEPLRAALRGLQSDDSHVRGTALDYLEAIVPMDIRRRLWYMLEGGAPMVQPQGAQAAAEVGQLLRRHESLVIRLGELSRERDDASPSDR